MGNHPNRNWRNKWRVDLATCTATHQDGLVISYVRDELGWSGKVANGMPEISNDIKEAQEQANSLARLMRQAGEIYKEHLDKRQ